MTIIRFGPLLALGGAACLIAWTPEGRMAPDGAALVSAARVDDGPTETASIARVGRSALSASPGLGGPSAPDRASAGAEPGARPAPPEAEVSDADLAAQFGADVSEPAPAAVVLAPSEPARSDADLMAQFAYADVPGVEPPVSTLAAPPPSSPDLPQLPPPMSEAAILYTRGDAAGLTALAAATHGGAGRTALEWAALRANAHPSFASLAAFLEAHPGWPGGAWVRARQEAELAAHAEPPAKIAAYFAENPPQSSAGKIAAARAAEALGQPEEASRIIRSLWRDGNFDSSTESVILREFGASLTKADHVYRASRLIYAGYGSAGVRAAALAGPDQLALAQARIEAARAPVSSASLRAVPPALRNDPGLLFSMVQNARRAGRTYEAAFTLRFAPHDRAALVSPDRWWSERKMVALQLLDLNEPQLAFEVCDQTVRPDSSEAEVDARFHAGWIALRFLHDAPLAAERFALAAKAAENPLSVARAAYWQGRAADAIGDAMAAKSFYTRAASVPIAFYGQLAARRLGETRLALRVAPAPAEGDARDEAVDAVQALYADGLDDLAAALAFDAARQWRDNSQLAAMADAVKQHADAGTEVQFAKLALMRGAPLDAMAFPTAGMPAFVPLAHSADLPTVYAVARQESEFIWRSASWAGAKGLMQMLPSTAASTARQAGVEFDPARLTADPAFNTQLGAKLLGQLIEDEGGSREIAFAAYNAGPGRVAQWIAAHGDPRDGTADLVDWIERIPFDETRDYVQRVSENLGVYRQLFADEKLEPPPVSARVARE